VDTSKVSLGEMIAGISALALFIFMFLPWYGIDSVGGFDVGSVDANGNAWEAFSFIDILLLVAIIIVGGLVLASAADATPDLPESPGTIIALTGAVATVLVLFRLIFTPDFDAGGLDLDVDVGREIGVFLGLIAAAGMAYGGYRAREEAPAAAGPRTGGSTAPPPPAPAAPSTPPPPADPPPAASTPPAGGGAPPVDSPPAAPSQPPAPGGDQPPSGGQSQY
jgi:hypothetical protein